MKFLLNEISGLYKMKSVKKYHKLIKKKKFNKTKFEMFSVYFLGMRYFAKKFFYSFFFH